MFNNVSLYSYSAICAAVFVSIMSANMNDSSSTSLSVSQQLEGSLWDVQDILAERRTANGESEVLVLWKPSWIPKDNMQSDGPVMRRFRQSPKARFGALSALGTLILPVEPGTSLATACAAVAAKASSDTAIFRAAAASASDIAVAIKRGRDISSGPNGSGDKQVVDAARKQAAQQR